MSDASPASGIDTRVFLISAGESTVAAVRGVLLAGEGRDRSWSVAEIEGVSPMDAAFNAMLEQADLGYHVQVDADMELRPEAVRTLRDAIHTAPDNVWQIAFPLWDTLFRRPIQGVKIYRSEVARRFPYRPVRHCEVDQLDRARAAGFRAESRKAVAEHDEVILGRHLVEDDRTAFWNCLDRAMRWKWLEERGVEHNWMGWILPYFHLFLERYVTERDSRFLYAWAGLVTGVSQPIPADWGEKDFHRPPAGFEALQRILSMTEEEWRRVGLPDHERRGLAGLARRVSRSVGQPGWLPSWRSPTRVEPPLWRRAGRRLARGLGLRPAGREGH